MTSEHEEALADWRRQRRAVWLSRGIVAQLVIAAVAVVGLLVALVTQPRDGRCEIYDDSVDEVLFIASTFASMAAVPAGIALLVVLGSVAVRRTGGDWIGSSSRAVLVATVSSGVVFVAWSFLCFAPGGIGF